MKGRPRLHHSERIINKAQDLFWKKGYCATSLSELLEYTGAGSGSFYNTFKGGKKEVFRRAIQQRKHAFNEFHNKLEKSEDALEDIKKFFRSIAEEDLDAHQRGCIIVNTVIEMSNVDEDLKTEASLILTEVEQMWTDAIAQAQKDGRIENQTNPEVLGKYLITFWCGLNTLRRLYPDKNVLAEQIEMHLAVLR